MDRAFTLYELEILPLIGTLGKKDDFLQDWAFSISSLFCELADRNENSRAHDFYVCEVGKLNGFLGSSSHGAINIMATTTVYFMTVLGYLGKHDQIITYYENEIRPFALKNTNSDDMLFVWSEGARKLTKSLLTLERFDEAVDIAKRDFPKFSSYLDPEDRREFLFSVAFHSISEFGMAGHAEGFCFFANYIKTWCEWSFANVPEELPNHRAHSSAKIILIEILRAPAGFEKHECIQDLRIWSERNC